MVRAPSSQILSCVTLSWLASHSSQVGADDSMSAGPAEATLGAHVHRSPSIAMPMWPSRGHRRAGTKLGSLCTIFFLKNSTRTDFYGRVTPVIK